MIRIYRYKKSDKNRWDEFVKTSVNGIFLFYRDYMDYHSDRFNDHSLLFYKYNKLIALLPCNEKIETDNNKIKKILSSHDGLTFGSFLMGEHTHQVDMLNCVEAFINYCELEQISEMNFKPIPILLQKFPSEQDVYALMCKGATLVNSAPSTIVNIENYIPNYGEKHSFNVAIKENLSFKFCDDEENWERFYILLKNVLNDYHSVNPVHSLSELKLLHNTFKNYIKLFAVFNGEQMLAGVIIFEYNDTIHTQYMASNIEGRNKEALHFCILKIIEFYNNKKWLEFGISSENNGKYLNSGLIGFKEGFKGNTLIYNKWRLNVR